jgi:hypothetical protein
MKELESGPDRLILSFCGHMFMDWIDLAEDWKQWRALLNTVMNLRLP